MTRPDDAKRDERSRSGSDDSDQRSWQQGAFGSQAGKRAGEGHETDTPDAARDAAREAAGEQRDDGDQRTWQQGAFGSQAGKHAGETHPGDRPDATPDHEGGEYGDGDTGKRKFGHDDDRGHSPDEQRSEDARGTDPAPRPDERK